VTNDVTAQTIELPTPDGPMACHEALPAGDRAPRGAVIVIQEAFGVNDYI
jgi:carboxymethylenebutenolidase